MFYLSLLTDSLSVLLKTFCSHFLSPINTPTYKLAKFLVPILKPLTSDEYTVKDSFAFAKQDPEFFMGILDVDSLLIISHLKILLTFAPIHFYKIRKK